MAQFTYDMSGSGGHSEFSGFNPLSQYRAEESQVIQGVYNPFIRTGYMCPAPASGTSLTFDNSLLATIKSWHYDPVNKDLYMADDTQVFRFDELTDTSGTRVVQISSAQIKDIDIYQINGVRKLFVMYQNASGEADIAVSNIPYDSTTDSVQWLTGDTAAGTATGSANATGGFDNTSSGDIFLIPADNGFAYLCFENQVHRIDGTESGGTGGTIYPNVLLFPPYFRVVDGIDYRGLIFLAVHQYTDNTRAINPYTYAQKGECGVYIWDRLSTVVDTRDFIPLKGMRGISKIYVAPNGAVRIIALDGMGFTHILQYTGSQFVPIKKLFYPQSFPHFRDSLDIVGNMAMWMADDGNVYAHGQLDSTLNEGLFNIARVSAHSTNSNSIFVGAANSSINEPTSDMFMYLSYLTTGSAATAERWTLSLSQGNESATPYNGQDVIYPLRFLPANSTLNYIDVYMARKGSSASDTLATLKIYTNQNATPISKTITKKEASQGFVRIEINKPYVNSVQLAFTYSNSVNVSDTSFMPSHAVIHYRPTGSR